MQCSAKAIANYFLETHLKKISHLKLQKLVYISHGWHLGIFDKSLITDEFAEAWRYGPVFPSLYHEFKMFGSKSIDRLARDLNEINSRIFIPSINGDDTQKIELLYEVWNTYGNLNAGQLSELTHQDQTPWFQTWNRNPGMRNLHIDNDVIKAHYREKLREIEENE